MRITTIAALASMVVLAAPLAAQYEANAKVMQAMSPSGKYQPPLCPLPGGNFQTSGAGVSVKTASEGGFTSATDGRTSVDRKKYIDLINHARDVASQAIAGNPKNAAAWYYLGRTSLMLGDIRIADSAFTELEKLSPGCDQDIKSMRQKAWLVLVNPSTKFLQEQKYDSALAILREANTIARYYPQGYYNLAATFANMKPAQPDSAIFYFKLAADKAGSDPTLATMLKGSIQNTAYMYQQLGDNANAIVYFRKYLVIDPNDTDAKRSLATALRLTGNAAEAVQIEDQLMAAGTLSTGEIAMVGVRLFNDKNYAGASEAFKKILAIDPYNHDALNNLANSYLALNDGKNLLEASKNLLAVDPLGENNVKLLANAYRLVADTTKWLGVVTDLQAMTTKVTVSGFTARKDGAKFVGTATGSEGRNANDKVIPPAAVTLVFDFYDTKGTLVTSQDVAIPALAPNAKHELSVDVTGVGIVSWKYHKK